MLNDVKISVRQFAVLVMIYTIGTTILVIPSGLAADAKQDAWLAAIIGVGLNLLIVCLFFIFFSFVGAATVLFNMGNFVNTQVMPETPIQSINLIFAIVVVMGVRLGLETLIRAAEIFFPWHFSRRSGAI
ncbi:GerAB/ArcD/ProY family transporter [Paenibacillus alginolyticus]|uniref:GerAB/ArcD/ProY family transporter n=1 Tax=Paenibacillus alginolyticus TaxID=59839 RepID=UPI000402F2F6|nr:GerAB/ArcD/ProY family transporter [Paenibacillus alginolyticus]MCY9667431.1 GerAB/ArcD/ProY family transporter [Paenibacillus alginolyticus]